MLNPVTAPPIRPLNAMRLLLPVAAACLAFAPSAHAQISFSAAIDLALKSSPRIKMAEADLTRSLYAQREARDVYIPSLTASGAGLGRGFGFPLSPPSLYTVSTQSLVYSFSQHAYIRSAADAVLATNLALRDMREQVAEDAATSYLALDRAQRKRDALAQEAAFAARLEAIVKDRLDAGQDPAIDYTRARRTGAALRLALLQLDDEIASDQDHLARLIGMAGVPLTTLSDTIPAIPTPTFAADSADPLGVQAAFATARARQQQALGDSRYALRPQFAFGASYSRMSTYNNAYVLYYPSVAGLNENAFGFSLSVNLPIFDHTHHDHEKEVAAEAEHALRSAENDRSLALEGRLKLQHTATELSAKAELAAIDKDLAQQQLDAVLIQLQAPTGQGPALTPKEEQNARILERQRYIEMLDADSLLGQTRISLLRQTGELESWLKTSAPSVQLTPTRSH